MKNKKFNLFLTSNDVENFGKTYAVSTYSIYLGLTGLGIISFFSLFGIYFLFFSNPEIVYKEKSNNIEDINSKLVIDFAQKKDKLSEIIINDVLENLGRGLASILATLNPSVIILGGSVAEGLSKFYWDKIITKTAKYSIPFYKSDPPIQMTTLGEDASILGASIIASS